MGLFDRLFPVRSTVSAGATPATGGPALRTFAVSDVPPATEPLREKPYHEVVAEFLGGPVEACSSYHGRLVANNGSPPYVHDRSHPLIAALHAGYATHRPVCLSPDIVWLTLCQGLAHHVNLHAEELRPRLVRHAGKLRIRVTRDDFVKGSPENPWPEVFAAFTEQVREHLGDSYHMLVADFSTTGPAERAAAEVVLLDAMQSYFSYEFQTVCGIPAVTLEGTGADWQALAARVQWFGELGLGWWVEKLRPVLDQFVAAAAGSVDRGFWESIYKWHGPQGSGSPYTTGWVATLFPYLVSRAARMNWRYSDAGEPPLVRNRWLDEPWDRQAGPGRDDFPGLPAKAPVVWSYQDKVFDMEFIAGLMGIRQDLETLTLRPEVGWVVRESPAA